MKTGFEIKDGLKAFIADEEYLDIPKSKEKGEKVFKSAPHLKIIVDEKTVLSYREGSYGWKNHIGNYPKIYAEYFGKEKTDDEVLDPHSLLDVFGIAFDPEVHQTDEHGKPVLNKNKSFRKKTR